MTINQEYKRQSELNKSEKSMEFHLTQIQFIRNEIKELSSEIVKLSEDITTELVIVDELLREIENERTRKEKKYI
ncbi:MAG: hypothetical protein HUJ53_04540 [Holdemanella sp.]|nr:hypothetical protein [Holdemanella sp.]